MKSNFAQEYDALRHGAALQIRTNAGILVLSDLDRADFLQRMTTNNVSALKPGESCVTVLTSPTARNLFVFTVLCLEQELWLLPAPGETSALEKHLRGNIFFMDKVKVRNLGAEWVRARLMGPGTADALSSMGVQHAIEPEKFQHFPEFILLHQMKFDLPGFELLLNHSHEEWAYERLLGANVCRLLDDEAYHARRIELGRPIPGFELTSEYTPLEAGLAWACSENKGCYTGQEIIARQITYDKVTKALTKLESHSPVVAGAPVLAEGKPVGTITSAVTTSEWQPPYPSLAILKRPFHQEGSLVTVAGVDAVISGYTDVPK